MRLLKNAGIVVMVLMALSVVTAYAQSSVIKNIRKEYYTINKNLASYKMVKKTLSGYSAEGSLLKVYYASGQAKKIYVKHFGETGYRVAEYYFKNAQLIFYYDVTVRYNKPRGMRGSRISSKSDNRIYFHHRSIVKWLHNSKNVPNRMDSYRKKYREIQSEVTGFLKD